MNGAVVLIVIGALATPITVGVLVAVGAISVSTLLLSAAGFTLTVAILINT